MKPLDDAAKARLKEIEAKLKALQVQFLDIKKRAKEAVQGGIARRDEKKIAELRKMLGLE